MNADTSALIEAVARLVSAVAWPTLLLFVVVSFRQPLNEFLANLGELSIRACFLDQGRREQPPGWMQRKAEEEPIPVLYGRRRERSAAPPGWRAAGPDPRNTP